jgi:deoxycytidylate deaminase
MSINFLNIAKNLPLDKTDWDSYFFGVALLASARADCTRRQFGCVAVSPEKQIIATGYNSQPTGVLSCVQKYKRDNNGEYPENFGCCKGLDAVHNKDYDLCDANHAETNALMQIGYPNHFDYIDLYIVCRNGQTGILQDAGSPCIGCSRWIKQFNVGTIYSLNMNGTHKYFTKDELKTK